MSSNRGEAENTGRCRLHTSHGEVCAVSSLAAARPWKTWEPSFLEQHTAVCWAPVTHQAPGGAEAAAVEQTGAAPIPGGAGRWAAADVPSAAWVPPAGGWGEAGMGKEEHLWLTRRQTSGVAGGGPQRAGSSPGAAGRASIAWGSVGAERGLTLDFWKQGSSQGLFSSQE